MTQARKTNTMKKPISGSSILAGARRVLAIEGKAVLSVSRKLKGRQFIQALHRIAQCPGCVAVIGIGKSGLVGRKLASTLSSTGTPAIFLHPVECLHGDLGMLSSRDIVLALSYSGQTEEMSRLIPLLKSRGLNIISITSRPYSRLARLSDIVIVIPVVREACPYNITPTASTAVMQAVGDAMAVSLMRFKGFNAADFAQLHPGGTLGKVLTMKVKSLMHTGKNNPVVRENQTVRHALYTMTKTRMGATSVVNSRRQLTGFFTDGDLRRRMQTDPATLDIPIARVMTRNPIYVLPDTMAAEAARIFSGKKIDNLPVINPKSKAPVGILDERDLLNEGLS